MKVRAAFGGPERSFVARFVWQLPSEEKGPILSFVKWNNKPFHQAYW